MQKVKVSLFDTLTPYVKLSPQSRAKLLSVMQKQELPKGHVLVQAGNICTSVYYIERGLARIFYLKDGREVIDAFNAENEFTCSINTYLTGRADMRQTELLEPSVVWSLPYPQLEALYDEYHDIERLGRHIITLELADMQRRLTDLQFTPAQERYANFVDDKPSLLQRVPLGMISSYLGMTQETLSRIRARM
ncbi:MAG: Crp/Fnr family transcriptional regulator [Flavobacterium sp.]